MKTRKVNVKLTIDVPEGTSDTQTIQLLNKILIYGQGAALRNVRDELAEVYRGSNDELVRRAETIESMKIHSPRILKA